MSSSAIPNDIPVIRLDESDEESPNAIVNDPEPCQICGTPFAAGTALDEIQAHYETHMEPDSPARSITEVSNPKSASPQDSSSSSISQFFKNQTNKIKQHLPAKLHRDDIFWFPAQSEPPPRNFTPGLVPILKCALLKSHANNKTQRAVLCYEHAVHIYRDVWDASWGCGYRNFEMACAALMDQTEQPLYFPLLDSPIPPGVRNLQRWVEAAWSDGFDSEGAAFYHHRLLGKNKWIGTGEIKTAFSHRGIPSNLVDFRFKNKPTECHKALNKWVVEYFDSSVDRTNGAASDVNSALMGASPVVVTKKMPIIVQYSGHSVTVVGYEVNSRGNVNLLFFDPSRRVNTQLRDAGLAEKRTWKSLSTQLQPKSSSEPEIIDVDASTEIADIDKSTSNSSRLTPIGVTSFDDILSFARSATKQFPRRSEFQILYFPMTEPLTDKQKAFDKVLTSQVIDTVE